MTATLGPAVENQRPFQGFLISGSYNCIKPLKVRVRITDAYVALNCEGRN